MQVDDPTGDDGLTPGERAEAAADAAGTKPGADAAAAAADADVAAAAAKKEAEDKAAAAKTDEPKPDPTVTALTSVADKLSKGVDALVAAATPKADAVVAEKPRDFDAERTALKEQRDKGEIDQDEYEDRREKILEDKAEWKADQKLNERLQTESKADADAAWVRDVDRFRADPDNAKLYDSKARNAAFNALVFDVAREMPLGTNEQWLTEARNRTLREFNLPVPGAADPAKSAEAIAKAERERAKAAGERPNPSIAGAPAAAAGESQIPDWMSNLDRMPISDQEDALAHLPADKLEEYLSSAAGGLKDNPRAI